MDENLEHKIRDLKLKIMRVEKELAKTIHNANLGAWLHAGHPSQMAKAGERERKRLEAKLAELHKKLEELAPGSVPKPVNVEATPQPVPPPERAKKAEPIVAPPAPEKVKTAKPKPAEVKTTKAKPAAKSKTAPASKAKPAGKVTKKAAVKKPAASKSVKPKKKK